MVRHVIGEASVGLIWLILRAWGRRWITTDTSRALTTAVMQATIWILTPRRPS